MPPTAESLVPSVNEDEGQGPDALAFKAREDL